MPQTPPILLLTRPEAASRRFLAELEAEGVAGFVPVISPLISILPVARLPDVAPDMGLIFTSANAVRVWASLDGGVRRPCYTVGAATAKAAVSAGFEPVSADGNAADLVTLIRAEAPARPLVHLRGIHTRGSVAERLRAAGLDVREAAIYDQPAQELSAEARAALDGERPVVLPLFSPRSAVQFARTPQGAAPLFVAAMSADVSEPLKDIYLTRLDILPRPDGALMRMAVRDLLNVAGTLVVSRGSVKG